MGGVLSPLIAPMLIGGNTSSATASSTSETSLFPASLAGTRTVPAGWFLPGAACRVNLRGSVSSTALPGTTTIRVKFNGVTVASTTMGSLLGGLSAANFQVIFNMQAYTIGPTGTMAIGGQTTYPSGLLGFQAANSVINATGIAFDSTQPLTVDCTAQHSVGGNVLQTTIATVELLPQVQV